MKRLLNEIKDLENCIETVQLESKYIPNSIEHLSNYGINSEDNPYTSDISDDIIEKIMLIDDIENMENSINMGIGVFTTHKSTSYIEIMKQLAQEQGCI